MSESQGNKFDLRAALTAKQEQGQTAADEHKQWEEVVGREFPRLLRSAYDSICSRVHGIPGVKSTATDRNKLELSANGETIHFIAVDPFKFATSFRGKIEIMKGTNKTKYAIVMVGSTKGPWELKIATFRDRELPIITAWTEETVDILLGRLFGLLPSE